MREKIVGMIICMLMIAGLSNIMIVTSKPLTDDVGVQSINFPIVYLSSYTQPVQVTVMNYGTSPERNFFVDVKIDDGTSVIYEEEAAVTSWLQPGATIVLSLPDVTFIPPSVCQYHVTACTLLSGDSNPANDCLTKTVYLDMTKPIKILINIGPTMGPFHFLLIRDTCSGLNHIDWTLNGSPWSPTPQPVSGTSWVFKSRFGFGTVTATVYDNCGNFA